jgi:hypothetical protein
MRLERALAPDSTLLRRGDQPKASRKGSMEEKEVKKTEYWIKRNSNRHGSSKWTGNSEEIMIRQISGIGLQQGQSSDGSG